MKRRTFLKAIGIGIGSAAVAKAGIAPSTENQLFDGTVIEFKPEHQNTGLRTEEDSYLNNWARLIGVDKMPDETDESLKKRLTARLNKANKQQRAIYGG